MNRLWKIKMYIVFTITIMFFLISFELIPNLYDMYDEKKMIKEERARTYSISSALNLLSSLCLAKNAED